MEDFNKIDDVFRSAVEPLQETPSDKVWVALDGKLAETQAATGKKKNNRRLFLLLAALLITSFSALIIKSEYDKEHVSVSSELTSLTASDNSNRTSSTNVTNHQNNQINNESYTTTALNTNGNDNQPVKSTSLN